MGIPSERLRQGDTYFELDSEHVMFKYDHEKNKCYRKFFGHKKEEEVGHDNPLLNEALRFGNEIGSKRYEEF